jgi:superfamily II DNA or RNA helicase
MPLTEQIQIWPFSATTQEFCLPYIFWIFENAPTPFTFQNLPLTTENLAIHQFDECNLQENTFICEESPLPNHEPREWQKTALASWIAKQNRGVVSVATGGGKTIFAFMAFRELSKDMILLVTVPTEALLDQWVVNITEELGIPEELIGILSSRSTSKNLKQANVVIINSARNLELPDEIKKRIFLVVDECHRSGSYENSKSLVGTWGATLGLSATPERQYDDGFDRYIRNTLGDIVFEYSVTQAIQDGILTPFELVNIRVPLTNTELAEHDKLTKRIGRLIASSKGDPGEPSEKLEALLRRRARNYQNAMSRVPVTIKLMQSLHGSRTIIFHESISAANKIARQLADRNHLVVVYHSKIGSKLRRDNLRLFRKGQVNVLVTCRALDEGLNIPETEVAIISSATSSDRQRIQRLGRVLRPSKGKESAVVYTLFATSIEQKRLEEEADAMPDLIRSKWQEVQVDNVDHP